MLENCYLGNPLPKQGLPLSRTWELCLGMALMRMLLFDLRPVGPDIIQGKVDHVGQNLGCVSQSCSSLSRKRSKRLK